MSDIKGVLFDAGGTLVVIDPSVVNGLLQQEGAAPVSEELQRKVHYQAMQEFSERRTAGEDVTWEAWVHRYFGLLGLDSTSRVAAAFDGGRGAWRHPLPGVRDALASLRDAHFRLAVVSNSDGTVRDSLTEAGLVDFMEFVIDSHELGVSKPDPRIFQVAGERMGIPLEHLLYIGDSPYHDANGAVAAGFGEVLLVDPFDTAGTQYPTVKGVAELPGWFGLL